MPDLELDIESNIKQIAADVKMLNKNLEQTANETNNAERSAKGFGTTIKNAAAAFIAGSALRIGVNAVKEDMMETHKSAIGIVKSLFLLMRLLKSPPRCSLQIQTWT